MQEFLNELIPNVMAKLPDFYAAIGDTLLMVICQEPFPLFWA